MRKILIVDDQEEIRDLVEKTLRRTDRKVYKDPVFLPDHLL